MVWTPHCGALATVRSHSTSSEKGLTGQPALRRLPPKSYHTRRILVVPGYGLTFGVLKDTGITLIEGAWRRALCPAPVNEGLGGIEGLGGPANVSRDSQPEGGQSRQRRARISRDEVNYGQGAPWLDMHRTSRVHWTHQHSLHQQEMREAESLPNPGHTFEVDSDCLAYANNRDNTAP